MHVGSPRIALLGAPGTDVDNLATRLRQVHPELNICTPAAPEPGATLVLLTALETAPTPPEQRSAQIQVDNALRAQLQALALPYRVVQGRGQQALHNALLALGLPMPDASAQAQREQAQYDLNRGRTPWSCEKCSDPDCEHRLFTGLLARR